MGAVFFNLILVRIRAHFEELFSAKISQEIAHEQGEFQHMENLDGSFGRWLGRWHFAHDF